MLKIVSVMVVCFPMKDQLVRNFECMTIGTKMLQRWRPKKELHLSSCRVGLRLVKTYPLGDEADNKVRGK